MENFLKKPKTDFFNEYVASHYLCFAEDNNPETEKKRISTEIVPIIFLSSLFRGTKRKIWATQRRWPVHRIYALIRLVVGRIRALSR